jgi:hypothetical protein
MVLDNKKTRTLLQDFKKPLLDTGGAAIRFRSSTAPAEPGSFPDKSGKAEA